MPANSISLSRTSQFWIFQLVGWGLWVSGLVFRDLGLIPAGYLLPQAGVHVMNAAAGILITGGLRYCYILVWDKGPIVRFLVVWFGSSIAALTWQPFRNLIQFIPIENGIDFGNAITSDLFENAFSTSFPTLLTWSALYFIIKYYQLFQLEKEKSLRSEALAHEAQLLMLRYQLNPHFLFNTLNAISTLVLQQSTDRANEMVTKLSQFLRYSLDHAPLERVSLAHEIGTLRLYLDIEKVRFAERLKIMIDLPEDTEPALVPSMLLQPLVENSIKHAISKSLEGGSIRISARKQENELVLTVEDDGPGFELEDGQGAELRKTGGVGVQNIRNRLDEIYSSKHAIEFSNLPTGGACVRISIPFES